MTEEVFGIKIPEGLTWSTSFQKWVEQWNAVTDVPTAIGLLHNIFRANEGEDGLYRKYDDHRVLFLLKLADGHRTNGRSGLAGKAFSVLAQEFFRYLDHDRIRYLSKEVDEALLDFFMRDDNVRWNDADAPQSNQVTKVDQRASVFMRMFCEVNWKLGSEEQRVKLVELLYEQNALPTLVPEGIWVSWKGFTEPVMQKLEEVGMRCESTYRFETDTPTLEELIYHGSPAARVLLLVRTGKQGEEKEKRRKELKEQAAQAAAGLAKLQA